MNSYKKGTNDTSLTILQVEVHNITQEINSNFLYSIPLLTSHPVKINVKLNLVD